MLMRNHYLKFDEPKTKIGKPLLGVTISYYGNNRPISRWYLNGESVSVEKISTLLGYLNKSQFTGAVSKYGFALLMTKGLDVLRGKNNI